VYPESLEQCFQRFFRTIFFFAIASGLGSPGIFIVERFIAAVFFLGGRPTFDPYVPFPYGMVSILFFLVV
jgi:hypothetical protein